VSLRRRERSGGPGLRLGATRDPAVNPKQGGSWLRPDLNCDRDARPYRRRKPHLDPWKTPETRRDFVLAWGRVCGFRLVHLALPRLVAGRFRTCRTGAHASTSGSIGVVVTNSGGGFPRPEMCGGGGPRLRACPVAQAADDSLPDRVLSGTQAQGRIERGRVATPGNRHGLGSGAKP